MTDLHPRRLRHGQQIRDRILDHPAEFENFAVRTAWPASNSSRMAVQP